jgi:predicted metal-dependent peptidase
MLRISNRDFRIWNMATDHVINLMLLDRGFELPPNGLWDKRFRGMSSEQVYTILEQEFPDGASDQSSGDDSGNGLPDDFQVDMEPAGDGTSDGMKQAEQEITQILVKAATQSKLQGDKPGTIPGEVEIALQKLLNPKLPWRTILQNYLHAMAPEDYSFKRVNRRFLPDVYLPTLYGEGLDSIAVAVDTSGSVTDQQFQAFLSEINDIHQSLRPKKLTVIDFDIRIRDVHELTQDQSVSQIKFTGRGGTNIRQVIDWAAQHKPQVMLIFTDGHFHVYDLDPGIPIIWIIHSNEGFTYGYGKVIEYPL